MTGIRPTIIGMIMKTKENAVIIGDNILFRLECLGLTQADVSRATGLPYPTINNYVRGLYVPNAVNIKKMAELFECSCDELLLGVE